MSAFGFLFTAVVVLAGAASLAGIFALTVGARLASRRRAAKARRLGGGRGPGGGDWGAEVRGSLPLRRGRRDRRTAVCSYAGYRPIGGALKPAEPLAEARLGGVAEQRRLLALAERLGETFGENADEWLHADSRYLGGSKPIEALRAGRVDRVEGALEALDSGFIL